MTSQQPHNSKPTEQSGHVVIFSSQCRRHTTTQHQRKGEREGTVCRCGRDTLAGCSVRNEQAFAGEALARIDSYGGGAAAAAAATTTAAVTHEQWAAHAPLMCDTTGCAAWSHLHRR